MYSKYLSDNTQAKKHPSPIIVFDILNIDKSVLRIALNIAINDPTI